MNFMLPNTNYGYLSNARKPPSFTSCDYIRQKTNNQKSNEQKEEICYIIKIEDYSAQSYIEDYCKDANRVIP